MDILAIGFSFAQENDYNYMLFCKVPRYEKSILYSQMSHVPSFPDTTTIISYK